MSLECTLEKKNFMFFKSDEKLPAFMLNFRAVCGFLSSQLISSFLANYVKRASQEPPHVIRASEKLHYLF